MVARSLSINSMIIIFKIVVVVMVSSMREVTGSIPVASKIGGKFSTKKKKQPPDMINFLLLLMFSFFVFVSYTDEFDRIGINILFTKL
mgnify:CR=1 FL=1